VVSSQRFCCGYEQALARVTVSAGMRMLERALTYQKPCENERELQKQLAQHRVRDISGSAA